MTEQWSSAEPRAGRTWYDDDELYDDDERSSSYPPDNLVTFRFCSTRSGGTSGSGSCSLWPAWPPHWRCRWCAPASSSSAKILLTHRDGDDPAEAMATDVSLATTHSVASRVIEPKLPQHGRPAAALRRDGGDRPGAGDRRERSDQRRGHRVGRHAGDHLEFRQEQVVLQAVPLRRDLITAQGGQRGGGGRPRARWRSVQPPEARPAGLLGEADPRQGTARVHRPADRRPGGRGSEDEQQPGTGRGRARPSACRAR